MDWINDEKLRLAFLFGGMFSLLAIELAIPLRQAVRSHTWANILMTLGLIVVNLLCSSLIVVAGIWAEANDVGLFRLFAANVGVQAVLGIIFLDFWAAYLSHYLFHKIGWLWRFHSVHHSDTMVDVTTAFRQHPVETLLRISFYTTGMILLGIPMWILLLYLTLSAINAQFEHANIKLPRRLDRFLQHFYVTPNMHKIHHSRLQPETDSNYSNILSIWDKIFGTYRKRSAYDDVPYGLDYLDGDSRLTFWGLLALPFRNTKKGKQ